MRSAKVIFYLVILTLAMSLLNACSSEAGDAEKVITPSELISGKPQDVPIPGMVTMVDIGAHSCIPCKMMTPIIEKLSKEYAGRVAIAFIDVWQNRDEAPKYGVRTIPTQIFYDAAGNEKYRHEGFLGEKDIVSKLIELGVK
ncbi:thioredoxin family protein [Desulfovibrio gilichinskyi]|uniref:Thioredoxin 1 n=1 Tax=Desulfovibrio gilichinskyi TaxID=1519643 RepID=A0A1X7EKC4_9BACT|nr:thioredoxin family protein [Desulfovibrio gilichinskyi]SMF35440.1 thioredoxin 1 [Desulfovibrio gilichinskyi]